MQVALVRHGDTDYSVMERFGPIFRGMRRDFAPLSELGRKQANEAGIALRPWMASMILSSPYTRSLETAALMVRQLGVPLLVEPQLHDWLPVRDGCGSISAEIVRKKTMEYGDYSATGNASELRTWETLEDVRSRAISALALHASAGCLIAVTHELVIMSLIGAIEVPYGSIHYFEHDPAQIPGPR